MTPEGRIARVLDVLAYGLLVAALALVVPWTWRHLGAAVLALAAVRLSLASWAVAVQAAQEGRR